MKERGILSNRIYLYLTEFFAGMSVMAVELGASRLLAPYFSSSQIVWTIIIGTIMIAMALGNLYGGRSADKDPDPDKLYARIIVAAIWTAAIPVVGTSITFLIFAGILLLLAIIYFAKSGLPLNTMKKVPISIVLFIVCCVIGHNSNFAFWRSDLAFEGESIYNYLQVYDDRSRVYLSTNVLFGVQSVYVKDKSLTGMYYDYAMAAPYMAGIKEKKDLSVLVLGMGTGTYATQCERYFDNVTFEGVEIDGKITDLAREYFDLPQSVKVTTYDGRAFLNAVDTKYDVIMVDAYQDITIPFQMASSEFFSLVKEHLNDNGVMVVNMNMRGDGDGDINEYLSDTIASVFPQVYTADVQGSTNRELFASANPDMISDFDSNVSKETDSELTTMMAQVGGDLVHYSAGGNIMTDDRAPVELLSMRTIDSLIGNEVSYYKDLYNEQGINGLLAELG